MKDSISILKWQHDQLLGFFNGKKSEFEFAHQILIKAIEMEKERIMNANEK
jgi:hypothetical protein